MTIHEQAVEKAKRALRGVFNYLDPEDNKHTARAISSANSIVDDLVASLVGVERAALPPLRAREEIARIIDPVAFEVRGTWMELRSNAESCQNALQKADAILSRTAGQEWRDTSVLQDDLRDMLRALGLPDGARPQSPHEVFRECIEVVKALVAEKQTGAK